MPNSQLEVRFGLATVVIGEDEDSKFVVTKFLDGAWIIARPLDEPWEHTRLHDPLHSYLAYKRGWRVSPTLWWKAHPDVEPNHEFIAYEEAAVLRCQKYLLEGV